MKKKEYIFWNVQTQLALSKYDYHNTYMYFSRYHWNLYQLHDEKMILIIGRVIEIEKEKYQEYLKVVSLTWISFDIRRSSVCG